MTRGTMKLPHTLPASTLILFLLGAGCSSGPDLFEDAAARQGLRFISYSGDHLWYLPDTMGSGAALGDYDGDGDADIFLLTGGAITDAFAAEAALHRNALWRNDGGGKFSDVSEESGLAVPGWSNGAAFGDYDGDGDLDLYVTRCGPNILYRNDGGRFADVSRSAGVDHAGWGAGAVWFDADGDLDLDLFVTNYAIYRLEEQKDKVKWFTDGLAQFPQHHPPEDDVLYRNNGDGTFTDITREAGAQGTGRGMGVVATDFDDDGDLDLFIANDVGFNDLLRNDGGRFTNVGFESGVAADENGNFQASMGVAAADHDADGDIDFFVTNYAGELNTLYRNDGGGIFTDITRRAGLQSQSIFDSVGWGTGIFDFDLDGSQDILVVNGHIAGDIFLWYMRNLANVPKGDIPQMRPEAYEGGADQERLLFLGRGDGTYIDATDRMGRAFREPRMGRGAAFGDLDADGRIDVAVTNKNGPAEILLNRIPPAGNWIAIELRSRAPNVFAIGARARVHSGGRVRAREIQAGGSYLATDDTVLHFGLGAATTVEKVEIRWPSGRMQSFENLEINRRHLLKEATSETPAEAIPAAGISPASFK